MCPEVFLLVAYSGCVPDNELHGLAQMSSMLLWAL